MGIDKQWHKPILKRVFISLAVVIALISGGSENLTAFNETELEKVAVILENMTLEEKVGQMFIFDFRTYNNKGLTEINSGITEAIRQLTPGGIILFAENTVEALQTKYLAEDLQRSSPKIPLFIAVDQEGGAVARLKYATIMPGNMALGAVNDKNLTYQVAKTVGNELKVLGINMNFAPVIDINNNPANPVIGVRSFGDSPEMVTELGVQFVKGLNDAGVIPVVKHFPGHGDTGVDSHIDLPLVPHDMDRLETIELKPYYAMIRNKVDMIMAAHVTFPAIDEREGIPATLSFKCLTTLLREKMGYNGVIITDAMNMKAITERFGDAQAAEAAIMAGADIVLMPQQKANTLGYITSLAREGIIPMERVNDSVKRILTLKLKRGILGQSRPADDQKALRIISGEAHQKLKAQTAAKAVTLIRNTAGTLPFKPETGQRMIFFTPSQTGTETVKETINTFLATEMKMDSTSITVYNYENLTTLTLEQQQGVLESDYVVLFTRTVNSMDISSETGCMASFALKLVAYAASVDKKLAAVAIRNPYDIQFMPEVRSYIAAYTDWNGGGVEAALRLIIGQIKPCGKLPVAIPDINGEILYPAGFGLMRF